MLGNPLTLGACVHSEQETSARILASSRTNPPPEAGLIDHPSDTPLSAVFFPRHSAPAP